MSLVITATADSINWPLMAFGFILLIIRVISMRAFILSEKTAKSLKIEGEYDKRFNGWFSPVMMHASFYISLLFCLSMIFSFRYKILNCIPITLFPSLVFSIPLKDFSVLLHPEKWATKKFSLFWWNYITLHIPMLFLGIYMFITREYSISKPAFYIGMVTIAIIFLAMDDLDNGVFKGWTYLKLAMVVLVIWIIIVELWLFPGIPADADPLVAPVLEFSWV